MSINTDVAEFAHNEAAETDSHRRAEIVFFVFAAVVLAIYVAAGVLFGLGGVGAVAIAAAVAMLVLCLTLTTG